MGTPIKRVSAFLSPRNFSKLSPKFLSAPRTRTTNENIAVVPQNKSKAAKNLFPHPSAVHLAVSPVKITVTNFETKEGNSCNLKRENRNFLDGDVLINTPKKLELLKNGLEKTKILNVLGKGTFGIVFRGIHKGQCVAVKLVQHKNAINEKNVLYLNHENITKTLEVIENSSDTFSLVLMDYFPNCTDLQSVLDNFDVSIGNKILSFALDITRGIEFCHNNCVLHLDLKPKNILVVDLKQCKICDFGNSLNFRENRGSPKKHFNHQGTIIYTAPEILEGKYPTTKGDIYSLGIIFWQIENRKTPHCDIDNIETVIYKVVKSDLRPHCLVMGKNKLQKIYEKCWSKNGADRPEAKDILLFLEKVL